MKRVYICTFPLNNMVTRFSMSGEDNSSLATEMRVDNSYKLRHTARVYNSSIGLPQKTKFNLKETRKKIELKLAVKNSSGSLRLSWLLSFFCGKLTKNIRYYLGCEAETISCNSNVFIYFTL